MAPRAIRDVQLAGALALACLATLRLSGRLDFLTVELHSIGRRWLGLVLLYGVLAVSVFLPVATIGEARDFDPAGLGFWGLFSGHLILVAFLVAWWLLSSRPRLRDFLSLRAEPLRSALTSGVFAGTVGWAITLLVTAAVAVSAGSISQVHLAPSEPPPMMLWLANLPIWKKAVVVSVAMTVEESFFRAFLQPRFGLMVSTILFALAHFNYGLPLMVVAVFVISLIFGSLFEFRRNLLSCIVAHGVFDAIQIFVIIPIAVSQLA